MSKRPRHTSEEEAGLYFPAPSPATQKWFQSVANATVVSKLEDLPGYTINADSSDSDSIPPFLCTHHGGFHCDEALALAMLKILPEYQDLPIVRTRDMSIIEKALLVVDVGGVFSDQKKRYDHHMGDFVEKYSEKHEVTKLSSAGLVYKFYGKRIVEMRAEGKLKLVCTRIL